MGLLDDAIKEHLELKRRRGADPTEVDRLEREALGPVRRMAEEGPSADLPASAPAETQYADDPAPERVVFDDELAHDHEEYEDDEFEQDTASHTVVSPTAPAPTGESPLEPEPARTAYAEPIAPYDEEDGPETAEYDVEAAQGHADDVHHDEDDAEDEESDDMLQETPEFLQDAPEHDRLWFEQRPPRDFDFDG